MELSRRSLTSNIEKCNLVYKEISATMVNGKISLQNVSNYGKNWMSVLWSQFTFNLELFSMNFLMTLAFWQRNKISNSVPHAKFKLKLSALKFVTLSAISYDFSWVNLMLNQRTSLFLSSFCLKISSMPSGEISIWLLHRVRVKM